MNVLEEAIVFATNAHAGQTRKMDHTPYILHPLEVAAIIGSVTGDLELMAAGVLHDTMEDCGVEAKELKARFGPRVAALVQSESEDRQSTRPAEETWMERKSESLLMLQYTASMDVKFLWLGDKLSNMRSFARSFRKDGHAIWNNLHQKDPRMHCWYYRTILENLSEFKGTDAYEELSFLIDRVFEGVEPYDGEE